MKTPIQMLLLEDNPKDAELLHATLEQAGLVCQIRRVETEDAFRKALDTDFDLIVSDFTLPAFDGKKALALAKQRRPDVPFIFVSGTIGEEAAIESLVGGATDYVLKHKFSRLVPAVLRALKETEEQNARREAERQLEITLEQLRSLLDNLDEAFFSFDPRANKLLQVSPACERVYGLPQQSFFDNPQFWKQVATPDDIPTIAAAQSSLEAGRNVSCEYRISANGGLRWVYLKMRPVRDADGQITRVDGIISDITKRKELEEQFLRAQRLENIGSLAGGIAHDLNNVLSPIVMGVELLREKHKDTQSQSTLALLELCAKRGANLVKQILMFARGVEGRRVTVHVGRLIIDLGKILQRTFPKSIRIATDVVPDLWTVSGDRTQLEQVLMNLCVNARDAMPAGGTLTVTARNQIQDAGGSILQKGRNVVIEVSDTGEGIPSENLDKIFDPFFTTKQIGTGTGLGLSTVNAIVKSHGGFVTVESSLRRGTAFRVYLPAVADDVPQEVDVKANTFPTGAGELILVVDDEAAVRDLARTILENYGYRVLVAADGADGVTLYSQNKDKIDLVLTDLDMPRMNGAEMIRVLERIDPEIRVITVSGLMHGDTFEGEPTGTSDAERTRWTVLQKPFSPAQLLQTLRNVLHAS
jgi:two-component system, cell cycle sensor histidine kinase and response regulator CckA